MAILSSIEDIRKHVAIASSFRYADFEPYILKAVNKFTRKYVGNLHLTLADSAAQVDDAYILNEARSYLQAALANFGMYIYVPLGSIMFDGSGMSNIVNDKRTPLSWQQQNDIRRELLSSGHEAMDLLLTFMEENKSVFPDWAASEQYTETKALLVGNTAIFQRYFNIFESRQTYLALQPSIRQVEDKYISTFLCAELITHLKSAVLNEVQSELKTILQKAVIAFTVAKVCDEGLFVINAAGIKLQFEQLPNDKVQSPDYGKTSDFLSRTARNQESNGQQYLTLASDLIKENLSEFTQCATPLKQPDDGGGLQPHNTRSILGL